MKSWKAILAVWSAVLLAVVPSQAEDRRTDKSILVIMTLNAEFLWDGVAPEEGNVDFPWKDSQSEAEEHMKAVANVVIAMDPDILHLVEVENLEALNTFNNQFLTSRGYRPYLVKGRDTATGQDVALLTRIDPEGGTTTYDDRKGQAGTLQKSVSKNYIAKFKIDGTSFALIGLHFLSRPNDPSRRLQREAQADAIRSMAQELFHAGYPAVILGDFNDYDGNADSLDHINSTPITTVLTTLRTLDPSDPADDTVNALSFMPQALRYTAFWDKNDNDQVDPPGEFTAIDHILLPKGLAQIVQSVEIPHTHDPRMVTDHFPVVVRLQMSTSPQPPAIGVRIASLLPNPSGDESTYEAATLRNVGTTPVDLTGWKLRDLAQKTWALDGLAILNVDESKTIQRNGQPMALNNRGDTIDLLNPSGAVVQTVTYPNMAEDDLVFPSN